MSTTRLAAPCWLVYMRDGRVADPEDRVAHHATREDAEEALKDTAAEWAEDQPEDVPGLHIEALPEACVTLTCDGCGHVYDEDDEGTQHFDSRQAVDDILGDLRWTWTLEGGDRCPDRHDDEDDREADTARAPGPNDVPLPGLEPTHA